MLLICDIYVEHAHEHAHEHAQACRRVALTGGRHAPPPRTLYPYHRDITTFYNIRTRPNILLTVMCTTDGPKQR